MKMSQIPIGIIEKENQQVDLILDGAISIKQFVISTRAECTKIENKHRELTATLETGELGESIDKLEQFHNQIHSLNLRTQKFIWHLSNLIEEII